jgi:hypothetical protein
MVTDEMETPTISFGNNANQNHHTFRHVLAAGLEEGVVKAAIKGDLQANAGAIKSGFNARTVIVGGKTLVYHAFKFADGAIKVGRITVL